MPATGRYRAAIDVDADAVAVVEVVHLVIVDVDAVATALLSMRDQRPAIAGLEIEIDLDFERALIDQLERPVSGKRRRARDQTNRRLTSQLMDRALKFSEASAPDDLKHPAVPSRGHPSAREAMTTV